ncbi:2',5' RNA ligase [Moritella sp. PE36]|uniref:RNA 2',3'-cyclic phosphodiesterase n=1 Tax=Moritella sp. PE36 TaxID=58051 RepID=UPI000156925B|nr:RNA 2',3'-cyclic phosphodiesterase [Moritella sp. PE36]EDM66825.1 2',5' RNA ligase [Moritella sp. PE36]
MPRLFTAIEVANDVGHQLNKLFPRTEQIPVQGVKHITVRFIGNVTEAEASAIELELISVNVKPFNLMLAGCQFFKSRGAKSIFVTSVIPTGALTDLHQHISRVLLHRGIKNEERTYVPHITLARISRPSDALMDSLLAKGKSVSTVLSVTGFVLYCAEHDPTPIYIKRREYIFTKLNG